MDRLNYEIVLEQLKTYDVVSFDVFDTLICRSVINPADVFKIVEAKAFLSDIISKPCYDDRIQAEMQSYREFGDRATIDNFYQILNRDFGYTLSQCNWLKEAEFNTELEVVYPRRDMHSVVNELINSGKRVVLCSDMYLSSEQIRRLLVKCGYPENLELWVSCEKGLSKSSGKIWGELLGYLPDNTNFIHVGDNEWSDFKTLKVINKDALLIEKGLDSFRNSQMYGYLAEYMTDDINCTLVMGYLINVACFNSPFENRYSEENVEAIWMGYAFACFMNLLTEQKDDSMLLFVTREGYLLKPMYERYCRSLNIEPQKNALFYASRAASIAATIASERDLQDTFSFSYEGTLGQYLKHRLNYEISTENPAYNQKIILPEDSKKVMQLLKPEMEKIFAGSDKQKEAYLKYIESIRDGECRKLKVVDVGYNGTIQYALSKILGEDVYGIYMFLNQRILKDIIRYNSQSLSITSDGKSHPILENLLFMEAVMQVPFGQLQKMSIENGEVKPVFNRDSNFSEYIRVTQDRFCQFIEWIGDWKGKLGNKMVFDFELAEKIWICLLKFNYISDNLLESFWLADDFAGHPTWKYDAEHQKWIGAYADAPLSFNLAKKGEKVSFKYRLKNLVKKYIPVSAYETARQIWIRYIK